MNLEEFDFAEMGNLLGCGSRHVVAAAGDDLAAAAAVTRNELADCRRNEGCRCQIFFRKMVPFFLTS